MNQTSISPDQKHSSISRISKLRRGDIILLAAILALALLLFLSYRFFFQKPGAAVEITVNGTPAKTLPLNENTTYKIATENQGNSHENILEIQNGYASITRADCPDKLCVHQKKISKKGETLVCLPHKIVVSVITSHENSEFDGIAH